MLPEHPNQQGLHGQPRTVLLYEGSAEPKRGRMYTRQRNPYLAHNNDLERMHDPRDGALLAAAWLRNKSSKMGYRVMRGLIVALHVIAWGVVAWLVLR